MGRYFIFSFFAVDGGVRDFLCPDAERALCIASGTPEDMAEVVEKGEIIPSQALNPFMPFTMFRWAGHRSVIYDYPFRSREMLINGGWNPEKPDFRCVQCQRVDSCAVCTFEGELDRCRHCRSDRPMRMLSETSRHMTLRCEACKHVYTKVHKLSKEFLCPGCYAYYGMLVRMYLVRTGRLEKFGENFLSGFVRTVCNSIMPDA